MRKILTILLIILTLFSCLKREAEPVEVDHEVTFTGTRITPSEGLKSTESFECLAGITPDYARIVITGIDEPFLPQVFELNGNLYTQAIRLLTGTYTVEQFMLMDDYGTPDVLDDDLIYMAVPETGAPFSLYVTPTVPFTITVGEFIKTEIPVQLICYQPIIYEYFGFDWFSVTEYTIREQCFFGDICVNPDDYLTSLYDLEQDPDGCQMDMPAIIEVVVKKNGLPVPYSPFTNAKAAANYGVGAPLCVWYPDNMNLTGEVFTFELYVLVKCTVPGTFDYQLYHTFQVMDDEVIANGGDGVVDFVIGTCSTGADYVFDWLPPPIPSK